MLVVDENRPLNIEFEEKIEKVYDVHIEPVNFIKTDETLHHINNKISNLTEGQITDTVMKDDLFRVSLLLQISFDKIKHLKNSLGSTHSHLRNFLQRKLDECFQLNIHKARTIL